MTKRFIVFSLFMALLIFSSCGKDDSVRYDFQPDTEAYFSYSNGTQWIYKSSKGGKNDTVLSTAHAVGMADRPEGATAVSSSSLVSVVKEKIIVRAEAVPTQNVDRIAVLTLVNGAFQPGPILLNLEGNISPEDSSVVTKLLTFDVAGTQYENIWEVQLKSHAVYKSLWFSRGKGIIKKVYLDNDTFDLIKFSPGN